MDRFLWRSDREPRRGGSVGVTRAPTVTLVLLLGGGCALIRPLDELTAGEATPGPKLELSASTDDPAAINLTWTLGAGTTPTAYRIERNGSPVATESAAKKSYTDVSAPSGQLSTPTISASQDRPDGIWLSFDATGEPGASTGYVIYADFSDGTTVSSTATGRRAAPRIANVELQKKGEETWTSLGAVTSTLVTDAPKARVHTEAYEAQPSYARGAMILRARPPTVEPRTQNYLVRITGTAGPVTPAVEAAGTRWPGSNAAREVELLWQRRIGQDPFADLPGVTGREWYDPDPVLDVEITYRVVPTSGWAEAGTTTSTSATMAGFAALRAGRTSACGLTKSGRRICWGTLGDNAIAPDSLTSTYSAVGLGVSTMCNVALGTAELTCEGEPSIVASAPTTTGTWKDLAISINHACTVDSFGQLGCWGDGAATKAPPDWPSEPYASVVVGLAHTCALETRGAMRCWGSNTYGEAPPGPSETMYRAIAAGDDSTCGLDTVGKLSCLGSATSTGPLAGYFTGQYERISVGATHVCAIDESKALRCSDSRGGGLGDLFTPVGTWLDVRSGAMHACGLRESSGGGRVQCWGQNDSGQAPALPSPHALSSLALGDGVGCAIAPTGRIVCWGSDQGSTVVSKPPTEAEYVHLAMGNNHGCALRTNGGVRCWGLGGSVDTTVPPAELTGTSTLTALAAGVQHSCGLSRAGAITCWGTNGNQQFPPTASAHTYKAIAAGTLATCALRTDGTRECWGAGSPEAPEGLSASAYSAIALGYSHGCGILAADKKLNCWGNGPGADAPASGTYDYVSAGTDFTCAIRAENGRLLCFGADLPELSSLKTLSEDAYRSVQVRNGFVCALRKTDAKLQCWGKNDGNQAPRL